jgi:hypothetical protein
MDTPVGDVPRPALVTRDGAIEDDVTLHATSQVVKDEVSSITGQPSSLRPLPRRVRCLPAGLAAPQILIASSCVEIPVGGVSPADVRLQVEALAVVWAAGEG